MNRIQNLTDKIARQLGYLPAHSCPKIEVTYERGKPPYVLIEPPGNAAWQNRVTGYVFPTPDGPFGVLLTCHPNPCICDSGHRS